MRYGPDYTCGSNKISPQATLSGDVKLGERVEIGQGAIVIGPVDIGDDTVIHPYAIIGLPGQHRAAPVCNGRIVIGKRTVIREYATVHSPNRTEFTLIGDDCYIMAYSHVAHDCRVGDRVTIANCTQLAGNVHVMNDVTFGLSASVHQHVFIGSGSMISMGETIVKHVPPFTKIIGNKISGFNKLPNDIPISEYSSSISRTVIKYKHPIIEDFHKMIDSHFAKFTGQRRRPLYTR